MTPSTPKDSCTFLRCNERFFSNEGTLLFRLEDQDEKAMAIERLRILECICAFGFTYDAVLHQTLQSLNEWTQSW